MTTYKEAGVDIDKANDGLTRIKSHVSKTFNKYKLSSIFCRVSSILPLSTNIVLSIYFIGAIFFITLTIWFPQLNTGIKRRIRESILQKYFLYNVI